MHERQRPEAANDLGLGHVVAGSRVRPELDSVDDQDRDAKRQRDTLAAKDLLRYATFVRLSLEHLIEDGASLDPGGDGTTGVSYPMSAATPATGRWGGGRTSRRADRRRSPASRTTRGTGSPVTGGGITYR